jgi:hypothetical protein
MIIFILIFIRIHECLDSKDYTLEILMNGLNVDNEKLYTKKDGFTEGMKNNLIINKFEEEHNL